MQSENEITQQEDSRLQAIRSWVKSELKLQNYTIEPASADASFRRYFRLSSGQQSWIIMDAPPDKEDCRPFVNVARLIESVDVHAPHIFCFNEALGFMQLADLGNTSYLSRLNHDSVDTLYDDAIQAIIKMQKINAELPVYSSDLLKIEMALFTDWYLEKHQQVELDARHKTIWQGTVNCLTISALQQPQVFVHRDYHSRNLMLIDENNPGVIDFQDAVIGPASYDLVSLIKDCYIAWPRHKQLQWIDRFIELSQIEVERENFIKQLDLMGMQRHLKAIGIFARLNYRDGKPGYLNDIPRTLAYVIDVCKRYEELAAFSALLEDLNIQGDQQTLERIA